MGDTAAQHGPGALVAGRFLLGPRLPGAPGRLVHAARDTAPGGFGPDVALALRRTAAGDPARVLERAARAQAAARLGPVADDVLAFGIHAGRGFVVTRRLGAPDALEAVERHGVLPPERAVAVVEALAGALDLAHADGFVHHGVGPAEVLLPAAGGVRLTGFGAHAAPVRGRRTPLRLGAAPWAAPEGLAGEPTGHRADVFGLAAVLGHLALGHWPGEARRAHPELDRAFEEALWGVLERGLHADPARRPGSAGALAAEARAVVDRAARVTRRRRRTRTRRTAALGALAGVAVLATAGGAGEPRGAVDAARAQRADRAFAAELGPLLGEAQRAARTFQLDVLRASARRAPELVPPEVLLARSGAVQRRRTGVLRRIARLRPATPAARQARELALTVLEGRLDHQRVLSEELRGIPARLRGQRLRARYAAARVPTRQLTRFVAVTSRTALTDAWNTLLRRAGRRAVPPLDL